MWKRSGIAAAALASAAVLTACSSGGDASPVTPVVPSDTAVVEPSPSATSSGDVTPEPTAAPAPSPDGVVDNITVEQFTFPTKEKGAVIGRWSQVVMMPDWAAVPSLSSEKWKLVAAPADAVEFFGNPVDPSAGAITTPSFVPTGKAKKFTITVETKDKSYTYTFTVAKGG